MAVAVCLAAVACSSCLIVHRIGAAQVAHGFRRFADVRAGRQRDVAGFAVEDDRRNAVAESPFDALPAAARQHGKRRGRAHQPARRSHRNRRVVVSRNAISDSAACSLYHSARQRAVDLNRPRTADDLQLALTRHRHRQVNAACAIRLPTLNRNRVLNPHEQQLVRLKGCAERRPLFGDDTHGRHLPDIDAYGTARVLYAHLPIRIQIKRFNARGARLCARRWMIDYQQRQANQ